MIKSGMTLKERQKARAKIRRYEYDRAKRQAEIVSRSPVCSGEGGLAVDHDRCKGEISGHGCLCECHDPDQPPQDRARRKTG